MMSILKSSVIYAGFLIGGLFCVPVFSSAQSIELNDPQILSVVIVVNQIDLDYAKIAVDKSHHEAVKKFAGEMVAAHTNMINQVKSLEKELIVVPQTNIVSRILVKEATTQNDILKSKPSKDFDRAYIDQEVAFRESAVSVIKNTLLHQVRNARIKDFLTKIAPVLQQQLEEARKVQRLINE